MSCKKENKIEIVPKLVCNKSFVSFLKQGGLDSIIITSTVKWNLVDSSNTKWLEISKYSGEAGATTVLIKGLNNTPNIYRKLTLTINSLETPLPPVNLLISQDNELKIVYFTNYKARGGATLNINGRGFSNNPNENNVRINGSTAAIQTASNTNLSVIVPPMAGSGPIIVSVGNKSDTSVTDFIYEWVGMVTVVAGGTQGYSDGIGASAQFTNPQGLAFDIDNNLYVADYGNSKVRKITETGVVSTIVGRFPSYLNPTGPNTDYGLPSAISKLPSGGLAIVEVNSNAITKFVAPNNVNIIAGGNQSGLINGVGTASSFYRPIDLAVDVVGNIYVADAENLCIRKITPGGVVTTFAGTPNGGYEDGIGTNAKFNRPFGIDIDASNFLYVTDYFNNRIRKISPAGLVTTIGGTGSFGSNDGNALTEAQFNRPLAICVGSNGIIYISEAGGNNTIRMLKPNGKVETIAEFTNISTGANYQFNLIYGLAFDNKGVLYASDLYNNRICKLTYK